VNNENQTASGVFIRLRKNGNPGNLSVRLENADGSLIEEGSISSSTVPTSYAWIGYSFTTNRVLESGKTYQLVLSAPSGDPYQTFPLQEGGQYGFLAGTFTDGHIQVTTGSSWQNFKGRTDFDLQFYFEGPALVDESSPPRNLRVVK